MRLSAPKFLVFLICLIAGVAAMLCMFGVVSIPFVSTYASYFLSGAFVLLVLSVLFKGL